MKKRYRFFLSMVCLIGIVSVTSSAYGLSSKRRRAPKIQQEVVQQEIVQQEVAQQEIVQQMAAQQENAQQVAVQQEVDPERVLLGGKKPSTMARRRHLKRSDKQTPSTADATQNIASNSDGAQVNEQIPTVPVASPNEQKDENTSQTPAATPPTETVKSLDSVYSFRGSVQRLMYPIRNLYFLLVLEWDTVSNPDVVAYRIYADNVCIKEIPVASKNTLFSILKRTHEVKKNYSISVIEKNGTESEKTALVVTYPFELSKVKKCRRCYKIQRHRK